MDIPAATILPPEIEELRRKTMAGKVRLNVFCATFLEKSERQGYNYVNEGMPHEYLGNTCLIPVELALEWLRGRRQRRQRDRNPEPRGRGRPRQAA